MAGHIKNRHGAVSIHFEEIHYNLVVKVLNDKYGIQVRGGCVCAGTYGHLLLEIDQKKTKSIRDEISSLPDDLHKTEIIQRVGGFLDRQIIGNYRTQKSNFIAYDILNKSKEENLNYNKLDKEEFIADMEQKIDSLAGEKEELRSIFLEMYAYPYKNKLALS